MGFEVREFCRFEGGGWILNVMWVRWEIVMTEKRGKSGGGGHGYEEGERGKEERRGEERKEKKRTLILGVSSLVHALVESSLHGVHFRL